MPFSWYNSKGSKVQRFHVFAPNVKGYIKMYNSKTKNVNEYMYNINHDHNELKKIDCDGWRQWNGVFQ